MKNAAALVFILLVADAQGRTDSEDHWDSCSLTDWGDWSAWSTGINQDDPELTRSWRIPDGVRLQAGARQRQQQMARKRESRVNKAECLSKGTCMQYAPLPPDGFSPCHDGYAGAAHFPCENINQMAFLSFRRMGVLDGMGGLEVQGNDLWGWTSPSGREYAIMGTTHATAFVDVTNPSNPRPVGVLNRPEGTRHSIWRDIKVISDTAYVVSEATGSGVQVFDLRRLENTPTSQSFSADYHYAALSACHNLVANTETGFLYAVGCREECSVKKDTRRK